MLALPRQRPDSTAGDGGGRWSVRRAGLNSPLSFPSALGTTGYRVRMPSAASHRAQLPASEFAAGIEICQAALGKTHSQAALGNDRVVLWRGMVLL